MNRFKKASDIRVGVIGYGGAFNMGKRHLEDMRKAGMTPTAVTEVDPARVQVAQRDFPGIEGYDSVAKMLKRSGVHLLAIITPHNTHAKLALQCLRAGRGVVTEKPFAITTAECDAMIREARTRKLVLSTYHNRHWDGCVLEAMRRIHKEKVIGEVYRIDAHTGGYGQPGDWWRSSKTVSGGILYDWGVHLLEYSLQIIDSEIVEVSAYAKRGFWAGKTVWKKDTNEDAASAVVRFRSGAWLTLTVSSLEANPRPGMLEISGTLGSYVFDGGTYEIIHQRGDQKVVTRGRNTPSQWERYYQNIADHLTKGEKLVITPEWARRPIHILDLADQSVRKGAAVRARYK